MSEESLSKGGRRREQIITAAMELFGEVGYRGTSLRDIAQRVGITHPGLLYHFNSKQELLSAVLGRRDETTIDAFGLNPEDQPEPVTSAISFVHRLLQLAEYNAMTPGIIELFSTLAAEATDATHPAHEYFKQRYVGVNGEFQRLFEALAAEGLLRDHVTTDGAGLMFTALMDGLQVQWLYEPEAVDMPNLLRQFFNMFLKEPV